MKLTKQQKKILENYYRATKSLRLPLDLMSRLEQMRDYEDLYDDADAYLKELKYN